MIRAAVVSDCLGRTGMSEVPAYEQARQWVKLAKKRKWGVARKGQSWVITNLKGEVVTFSNISTDQGGLRNIEQKLKRIGLYQPEEKSLAVATKSEGVLPKNIEFSPNTFRKALERDIIDFGFSDEEAAEHIGCDPGDLRDILSGKANPTWDFITTVKDAFEWSDFKGNKTREFEQQMGIAAMEERLTLDVDAKSPTLEKLIAVVTEAMAEIRSAKLQAINATKE